MRISRGSLNTVQLESIMDRRQEETQTEGEQTRAEEGTTMRELMNRHHEML